MNRQNRLSKWTTAHSRYIFIFKRRGAACAWSAVGSVLSSKERIQRSIKIARNKTRESKKEVNMKTESTVMESADIVIGSFVLTQWGLRISR